mmetsp:Transcript_10633/g.20834  ORF Transcript_10633/g.20834 Transcript_10633/m.20834 type:complete len:201 (+) Transcript_10633:100-702(+)
MASAVTTGPILEVFNCGICRNTMKNPVTCCSNGHSFCEGCIRNWQKRANTCPVCRSELKALVPNHALRDTIDVLKLRCPNDCGFEGSLAENEAHVSQCTVVCSINFTVKQITGGDLELEMKSDATLTDLHGVLEKKTGISAERQRLHYKGRSLQQGQATLRELAIAQDCTIYLLLACIGGAHHCKDELCEAAEPGANLSV